MKMTGSEAALRYAARDLASVEVALGYVATRKAAIQAGACLGVFPAHLAVEFETVYAFEPDQKLFQAAQQNFQRANVVWFQAALGYDRILVGTKCSRRDGSTKPVHEGLTHVVPGGGVPTLRIDDLNLPECGLICLDVEGCEVNALHGARETISRCRPVLIVEINKQIEHSGFTADQLRYILKASLDYEFIARCNSDEIWVPK